MVNRSWKFIPVSQLGKWSVGLIAAMPLIFIIGISFAHPLYESVPTGDNILLDITKRPILALTMLTGMISGIMGFITGLTAIIRKKEKAVLVYISSLIGALFIFFLIGEILFPH